MGTYAELKASHLPCLGPEHAALAAVLLNNEGPHGDRMLDWFSEWSADGDELKYADFDGDHWHGDDAALAFVAMAPFMAKGAYLEFEVDGEDFRIEWDGEGRVFERCVETVVWDGGHEITAAGLEEERKAWEERSAQWAKEREQRERDEAETSLREAIEHQVGGGA